MKVTRRKNEGKKVAVRERSVVEPAPVEAKEPFDLSPELLFDRVFYGTEYPDIATLVRENGGFEAKEHFYKHGLKEGRHPSLYFNIDYVRDRLRKEVGTHIEREATIDLFFSLPRADRFIPNQWFNPWAFRTLYGSSYKELADLDDYGLFVFYVRNCNKGLSPNGLFDEGRYLAAYPDIAEQVGKGAFASGFAHFLIRGWAEGRTNIPQFGVGLVARDQMGKEERTYLLHSDVGLRQVVCWLDEAFYFSVYPDAHALRRAGKIKCGLEHFLLLGAREGRIPHPGLFPAASDLKSASLEDVLRPLLGHSGELPQKISLDRASQLWRHLKRSGTVDSTTLANAIWGFVEPPPVDGVFDEASYLGANPDVASVVASGLLRGADHWRQSGIREQRIAPGSNIFGRRQLHLEDLAVGNGGVNVFGPVTQRTGLGVAIRGYVEALTSAGVPTDVYDVSGLIREGAALDIFSSSELQYSINLICLNPDQIMPFVDRYGAAVFEHRVNVGAWVWELPTARPEWLSILSGFDIVVAPSEYCRDAFSTATARPVIEIPYVVDKSTIDSKIAGYTGHPAIGRIEEARKAQRTVVLFIMDASSYTKRKGVDVLAEIIAETRRRAPGEFVFVIKSHSKDLFGRFDHLGSNRNDLLIIDGIMDEPDLYKLKTSADIYISPHRSEGFGLNIFESLVLGVPALCSRYAGATSLLPDDYPYYIPGRFTEVGAELGPYRSHAVWFEPDVEEAVSQLIAFRADSRRRNPNFLALAKKLCAQLSTKAVGERFRRLLEERCCFNADLAKFLPVVTAPRSETLRFPQASAEAKRPVHEVVTACIWPIFSVITPTFDAEPWWLQELYDDLCRQTCGQWEWCIVDDHSTRADSIAKLQELQRNDSRIKVKRLDKNAGIAEATNRAVEISCGKYLVLVDHDDRISPSLLDAYYDAFAAAGGEVLLYCDEDKLFEDGRRGDHYFKPDWSPEHLMSTMYVLHCLGVPKALFLKLEGYRRTVDGAQDHDFALRAASSGVPLHHVDRSLYHWRVSAKSAAGSQSAKPSATEAGRAAVADHLARLGISGTVEHGLVSGTYRVRPKVADRRVSLNILTACTPGRVRDERVVYAEHFVRSIVRFPCDFDLRIRVIVDAEKLAAAPDFASIDSRVEVVPYEHNSPSGFNFAGKANFACRSSPTEQVILLNDDMEALNGDWVGALLEPLEIPGVGIAGGRLLYADDTVQHSGIVLGVNGPAAHIFGGVGRDYIGYNAMTHVMRNYSAVTGALMAFRKSLFQRIGGFDDTYPIDFNDVDLCLRANEANLRVVFTPFAELRHFESQSAKRAAADSLDVQRFSKRWRNRIERDPYYNRNLRRDSTLCEAVGY